MPLYSYEGTDVKGKQVRGLVAAVSRTVAHQKLKERKIFPTAIEEDAGTQGGRAGDDDVARVVVGTAAVQGGGVVADEGVVDNDGAGIGIHSSSPFGLVEGHFDLVVFFFRINTDGTHVGIDAAAVLSGLVEGNLRLFAEDVARSFHIVLNVDVAHVGIDAAAVVAGFVASVGVIVC